MLLLLHAPPELPVVVYVADCPIQSGEIPLTIPADKVGFTVIVTSKGVPGHPFANGVILYTAVPAVEPVAVKVWAILKPLVAVAPDTSV